MPNAAASARERNARVRRDPSEAIFIQENDSVNRELHRCLVPLTRDVIPCGRAFSAASQPICCYCGRSLTHRYECREQHLCWDSTEVAANRRLDRVYVVGPSLDMDGNPRACLFRDGQRRYQFRRPTRIHLHAHSVTTSANHDKPNSSSSLTSPS